MRRLQRRLLIGATVVLFLAVSVLLARVFGADGAEQAAITALIQKEASGDQAGMAAQIKRCRQSPSCLERVKLDASRLRRPGPISIVQLSPSTGFSLTGTEGTARVVWKVPSSLPIVQCLRVRRRGNAISGIKIELEAISSRIQTDADCPARF